MDALGMPAIVETHTAMLFMVDDRVYKRKKPVALPFVDFRPRPARRRACQQEVELNRRLAPDVYLGVADMSMAGELWDHFVVMRRMPDDRRLAAMVEGGEDVSNGLRDVARAMARFHSSLPDPGPLAAVASPASVAARWAETVEELRAPSGSILDPDVVDAMEWLAHRYVAGRQVLFAERLAGGHVRDGHGDLLADDIFLLDDGPRILDCLDFDERLRHGDVLADVAFLAMDLERLGAGPLAKQFLHWYCEFSGESWPGSLAHHYIAYRAAVRTKVACIRNAQAPGDGVAAQARSLCRLSVDHLEQSVVELVLVGGLPGTGKTSLAGRLASELAAVNLSSDEIRKQLSGLPDDCPAPADWREGLYAPAVTERVYATMIERAGQALARGESVVLDASWAERRWRSHAVEMAAASYANVSAFQCVAPTGVAAARIARRAGLGRSASDATAEVAARMATVFEPWPEATVVDTAAAAPGTSDPGSDGAGGAR